MRVEVSVGSCSPVEYRGAWGELNRLGQRLIQSEHTYCNIPHMFPNKTSKCTHTHGNRSTATRISAWVIPKAFTITSLEGRGGALEEGKKKQENPQAHTHTQRASESKDFSCLPDTAWGAAFWLQILGAPERLHTAGLITRPFTTLR